MKCTKNRWIKNKINKTIASKHTNNHSNFHDQCSHILSSSAVSCKTFSSLSLLRPATAHLNFPLQFLATSLTTNWPVNPLAPNTTTENCLSALAMFCFSCFQRVVRRRRADTGKEIYAVIAMHHGTTFSTWRTLGIVKLLHWGRSESSFDSKERRKEYFKR